MPRKAAPPKPEPKAANSQPYPVGFQRDDAPELWGWAEVLDAAERTDFAMRYLRAQYADEFPVPYTVLAVTPVYVADEIREFLKNHPRTHVGGLADADVERLYKLVDQGLSYEAVGEAIGCSTKTVQRYMAKRPYEGEAPPRRRGGRTPRGS